MSSPSKPGADRLRAIWDTLDSGGRATLLAFAEFLQQRHGAGEAVTAPAPVAPVPEPEVIERPAHETIVAGLKRLAKTYFMLDKSEMLSATSDLVATHIMKGTEAGIVIDQLEAVFSDHYRQLRERNSRAGET